MAQKIWYLFKDNHHIGPFSAQEVKSRFDLGEFSTSIPVWREGDQEWLPLSQHPELSSYVMPTEIVELPALPPLPVEVYEEKSLPETKQDGVISETTREVRSKKTISEDVEKYDLSAKIQELEQGLPKSEIEVEDFWKPDLPLDEKWSEVRIKAEKGLFTKNDTDPLIEKNIEENLIKEDPIRPAQEFDGDSKNLNLNKNIEEELSNISVPLSTEGTKNSEDIPDVKRSLEKTEVLKTMEAHAEIEVPDVKVSTLESSLIEKDEISPSQNIEVSELKQAQVGAEEKFQNEFEQDVQELSSRIFLENDDLKNESSEESNSEIKKNKAKNQYEQLDEFEEKPKSIFQKTIKFFAIAGFFAVIAISANQFFFKKKKIPALSEISDSRAREFREVVEKNTKDFHYTFAVSNDDRMNIWFANNRSEPGTLEIKITSKKNRVLSNEQIVAVGQTEILSYIGKFKEVKILEGQKLAEGEYHVEGSFVIGGAKINIVEWLKKKSPLGKNKLFLKYLATFKKTYTIDTSFYFSTKQGEQFRSELAKFQQGERELLAKPILVEIQKWRTLKSLIQQVSKLFEDLVLGKKIGTKEASDVALEVSKEFEAQYGKNISPVFQTLTSDTQALIQSDQIDPLQQERLENLLELQKSFGSVVSINLESLTKYKKLTDSIRNSVKTDAEMKFINLEAKAELQIRSLQNQLTKLSE